MSCSTVISDSPTNAPIGAPGKAGRLRSIRVLVDTFDLVEQALGRPINLPKFASIA